VGLDMTERNKVALALARILMQAAVCAAVTN
jgi:hypothetical protein